MQALIAMNDELRQSNAQIVSLLESLIPKLDALSALFDDDEDDDPEPLSPWYQVNEALLRRQSLRVLK